MKKYLLVIAASLAVIVPVVAFRLSPKPSNTDATPVQSTITYPPIESLGHGARLPTAEELEQEKAFDARQAESAIQQLKSADVHRRIVATETLNAYQTPKSEQQLSDTMLHDQNAEVRQTAAQSLAFFKDLSDRTVDSLFKALHDKDRQPRKQSLDTLLNHALRISGNNDKFQRILKRLRNEIRSGRIDQDVRSDVNAFLKDQQPVGDRSLLPPPIKAVQH
ncbi:HEAT repeat domain-containing protein [Candidatus Methylobacter oryzae]|uniref:HEAT repeat domain-containing protein n=1 Tax=Candidatus Methylobacter oryzae TaxID=2497749 RepID=A0ABY3CDY9_9GAMM|nr:HEAT repeat domain-containing protein [Candidatus Methylobacter oryzae]TRX00915.1 HEAT repeat domain-containing protein [Candidatus Methylobacter oryzae]